MIGQAKQIDRTDDVGDGNRDVWWLSVWLSVWWKWSGLVK
jgi:hypothetical protein